MGEFGLIEKFKNLIFKIFLYTFFWGIDTKRREVMGRKRKFGEESDFVSIRVPKSKRKEYRTAIKNFVEKKFANESATNNEVSNLKNKKKIK